MTRRRLPLDREVRGDRRGRRRCGSSWSATTARPPCCGSRCRCWPARSSTPRVDARRPRCASSSPRRSPGPRPRACCSRVHLKATMMKVSDPIIFGHAVRAFFPATVRRVRRGARRGRRQTPNDGLGAMLEAARRRCPRQRAAIEAAVAAGLADGPALAMVDSDRGHHQPARAQRRDRRRVDAGDDPHLGPHVGPGRRGGTTPWRSSPTAATPASTRSSSTTAAPTAPTTRRRWARCPTSG